MTSVSEERSNMHHITWFGQTVKIHRSKVDEMIKLTTRLRKAGIEFKHTFWD